MTDDERKAARAAITQRRIDFVAGMFCIAKQIVSGFTLTAEHANRLAAKTFPYPKVTRDREIRVTANFAHLPREIVVSYRPTPYEVSPRRLMWKNVGAVSDWLGGHMLTLNVFSASDIRRIAELCDNPTEDVDDDA